MSILLFIHAIVTLLLIGIVLIQKTEGGSSLFASGGSSSSIFNARGQSNFLTKSTWILATIFLANCILMAYLAGNNVQTSDTIVDPKTIKASMENKGGRRRIPITPTKTQQQKESEQK